LTDWSQQIISQKAVEIVDEFPNGPTKDKYRDVASRLRLPFWDWAKKIGDSEPVLPVAITQLTVGVTFPNGTKGTIDNPLLLYRFHPLGPNDLPAPWNDKPTTLRNSDGNGNSQPAQTEASLRQNKASILEQLYQILTQWQRYNEFSNHGSEPSFIGNIESVHDAIHGAFGFAHMGYPSAAAFDPVFWLHHANVDRFLAIWQRLYPDTYVEPHEQAWPGTWTIAPSSSQGVDSPLTPFHKNANGDYHTSASSRFTDSFQYTYPEIIGNPSNATLKATINRLYAPSVTSISKRQEDTPKLAVSPEQPRAFLFAVEAPLFVQGAYSVQVFLGDITAPTEDWTSDPNFVGGQTMMTRAPNEQIVKGSVVLTESLRKKFDGGALGSLETGDIVTYLKDNLHWRVQKSDKSEIPREDVPHFKVTVLSTEVKPAESVNDFPTFVGGWEEHTEVTAGKPGGRKA
jgi:tyrosinase